MTHRLEVWRNTSGNYIVHHQGLQACIVHKNVPDAKAYAQLFAAAPELLDALERVMQTNAVQDDDHNKGCGTVYDDARDAIRKAKGEE